MLKLEEYDINPVLIMIDMQNGFVSKGGSQDLLGMDEFSYQRAIPRIHHLISMCRSANIPINLSNMKFYTLYRKVISILSQ